MNATMRGGTIWLAHTTAVDATGNGGAASPDRNAVRWYQIGSPAAVPAILQSGTVFDPSVAQRSYVYGSVNASGQRHAMFGFSLIGAGDYAGVGVDGRLLTDPSGTTQGVRLATAGLAAYVNTFDQGQFLPGAVRRWGDFSNTQVDPDDDMTFWTIQEFADADGTWATRVVRLLAPPPATPIAVTPSTIPAEQASAQVTVTGQSVAGSGFFDPGSGYAKRVGADIPGVTINGVVYNRPTSVTLDVSTVGSLPGTRNVTIVNPDGQSATGIGLLVVGAPGGQGATAMTIASALNPATSGQGVSLIATVAPVPPASGMPTGTVTFYDGLAPLGTVPLAAGAATLTTFVLASGAHAISATYNGDSSFYGSNSAVLNQQILSVAPIVTVTNNGDTGVGSLRNAIATAKSGGTIVFNLACPTTITLMSGALIVDKSMSLVGPGARCLTVSGNNASRVFGITEPGIDVAISGMTIMQGRATSGGGIQSLGSEPDADHVALTGNNAQGGVGGGIDHEGRRLALHRRLDDRGQPEYVPRRWRADRERRRDDRQFDDHEQHVGARWRHPRLWRRGHHAGPRDGESQHGDGRRQLGRQPECAKRHDGPAEHDRRAGDRNEPGPRPGRRDVPVVRLQPDRFGYVHASGARHRGSHVGARCARQQRWADQHAAASGRQRGHRHDPGGDRLQWRRRARRPAWHRAAPEAWAATSEPSRRGSRLGSGPRRS